ncbi:hypothetical protein B0H17DRAFT_1137034 [Mycena rosella]|uniref:Uncharacterized protein n=1 Tax=Mycena rosella TaxID=1033263 RepID=A0AAD7D968_MYCRO|nr:hypothetical protein B0H17DRAFT_1137034 [Mycena rosella]
MFSKVLAFGLLAMTLVRAMPSSQIPLGSCNMEYTATSLVKPGIYRISNGNLRLDAEHAQSVHATTVITPEIIVNGKVGTISTPRSVADLLQWTVEHVGGSQYRIYYMPTGAPVYRNDHGALVMVPPAPDYISTLFDIFSVPGQQNTFVIRVPHTHGVWDIDNKTNSYWPKVVVSEESGSEKQKWQFEFLI